MKDSDKHHQMADINDVIVRTAVHVDDGRDYTGQIVHHMKQNYYIHEGICPPLPPAPKVAAVTITPIKKGKRGKR
ncbi:hypothetical protein ID858_03080 [Xenorhabdus sp. DI]|uniref:hypothetical protein n=1 Tax=Xenorhabdus doucetiae TaxID=351671 RepID=UPI0019A3D3CE|nr:MULTISPECIES: hypothetical protein [unclassified Xenorhabdus]MBD2787490.1 hypothetical protein [Xenorhabdus sp. DI]